MNTAHRIADGLRSVISYWTPTPTTSQFVEQGTLTPQEFVEAGDQLTFKFPTWRWQRAEGRRQVSWLPPDKQYLATYGVSCRCRVKDLDQCVSQSSSEPWEATSGEAWLIPSSPATAAAAAAADHRGKDEEVSFSNRHHTATSRPPPPPAKPLTPLPGVPGVVCFSEIDDILDDEDTVAVCRGGDKPQQQTKGDHGRGEAADETTTESGEEAVADPGNGQSASRISVTATRSYDLSVTYDKYYQTPRLWLKGYNEQGLPLESSEIFEDILTDYVSKTVTIDPHPCTGELTVSIHPCRHAAVMKKVVNGWLAHGIAPRHDLALVVLLKLISSVIPTIQYDTTADIYGFWLGGPQQTAASHSKRENAVAMDEGK